MAINILTDFDNILKECDLKMTNTYKVLLLNKLLGLNLRLEDTIARKTFLKAEQKAILKNNIEKIKNGCPIQYILNSVKFAELDLYVDERVLIPRSETEEMVYQCYELIPKIFGISKIKVADIGTGSGAIALGISHLLSKYHLTSPDIYAIDIQQDALDVASKNIAAKRINNIRLLHGDLLAPLIENNIIVDVLIANLPYVKSDYNLDKNVKYEPLSALDGGSDGLRLIEKLLIDLHKVIHPKSIIFLEIGFDQKEAAEKLCQKYLGKRPFHVRKDMYGNYRYIEIAPPVIKNKI